MMTELEGAGQGDRETDGTGGSVDAVMGAAISPSCKSRDNAPTDPNSNRP